MTEPRRWLEDSRTSAELRQLLKSAGAPPPLPPDLHAQLCEYVVGLASQSLLAKVGGGSLWHKLLQGLAGSGKALTVASLVGAAAAGTYAVNQAHQPPSVDTARAPLPAITPATAAKAPFSEPVPVPSNPGIPAREARPRAGSVEPGAPRAAREQDPPQPALANSGEESVADEAKLLETARSFLGDSPALALELTEQHRQRHPAAQLNAEREFIAVEALLRLGRRQEAEQRAAPRLEQSPDSLYARRLRQLLSPMSATEKGATPANSANQ